MMISGHHVVPVGIDDSQDDCTLHDESAGDRGCGHLKAQPGGDVHARAEQGLPQFVSNGPRRDRATPNDEK